MRKKKVTDRQKLGMVKRLLIQNIDLYLKNKALEALIMEMLETMKAVKTGDFYEKCVREAQLWKKKKGASPKAAVPRPRGYRPR